LNIDNTGDGLVDQTEVATYDASNNLTSVTIDTSGDGEPDWIEEWTYENNQIAEYILRDFVAENMQSRLNTFDANGLIVKSEVDQNMDGEIDLLETFTYDENNNLIQIDLFFVSDSRTITLGYVRDANGNVVQKTVDGLPSADLEYDDRGNLKVYVSDVNGTNTDFDFTLRFSYDNDNFQVNHTLDEKNDGTINFEIQREFDFLDGRLERSTLIENDRTVRDLFVFYSGTLPDVVKLETGFLGSFNTRTFGLVDIDVPIIDPRPEE